MGFWTLLRGASPADIWRGLVDVANLAILVLLAYLARQEHKLAKQNLAAEDPCFEVVQVGAGQNADLHWMHVRVSNHGRRAASLRPIGRLVARPLGIDGVTPVAVIVSEGDQPPHVIQTRSSFAHNLHRWTPATPVVPPGETRDVCLLMDRNPQGPGWTWEADFQPVTGTGMTLHLRDSAGFHNHMLDELRRRLEPPKPRFRLPFRR